MVVFPAAVEAAKKGEKFEIPMYEDTRFAQVHQDDLADLYLRVAERVSANAVDISAVPLADCGAGTYPRRSGFRRLQPR